jgi:RimJ/RimL family protein N-acetyltransferase
MQARANLPTANAAHRQASAGCRVLEPDPEATGVAAKVVSEVGATLANEVAGASQRTGKHVGQRRRPAMAAGAVSLRDVEDGDLETFFEQASDPEAVKMAAFPARERDAFLAHWQRTRLEPSVVLRTVIVDGQVAGNVVSWSDSDHREVGYWLGQDFWGRGIATAALGQFLKLVSSRPLEAHVAAHNTASRRVLEKCGFRATAPAAVPVIEHGAEMIRFVLDS